MLEHVAAANKSAAVFSSNYFQRLAVNNVFHVPPDFATSRKIVNGPRLYETR